MDGPIPDTNACTPSAARARQSVWDVDETELRTHRKSPAELVRELITPGDVVMDTWNWSHPRKAVYNVLTSQYMENVLGLVIATNIVFIVLEVDQRALCLIDTTVCGEKSWLTPVGYGFLGLYTVESLVRIAVWQRYFHTDAWNVFDLFIVLLGYVDFIFDVTTGAQLPSLQMLRLTRVARLARAMRIFKAMPELQAMIEGFKCAVGAMLWGFVFICFLLLVSAILAVEFIHPVSNGLDPDLGCKDVFGSVFFALVQLFQTLVAGDSWGTCAVPIVTESPLTFIIFAGALVTVQLGFTNLILSVIVDKAAEARDADGEQQKKQRARAARKVENIFLEIAGEDQQVSREEFRDGVARSAELRDLLKKLDLDTGDLHDLFELMDTDQSGDLSLQEFSKCITKSMTQNTRRQMMFLQLQVDDWVNTVEERITSVESHLGASVAVVEQQLDELVDWVRANH